MNECVHGRPLSVCAVCAPAAEEALRARQATPPPSKGAALLEWMATQPVATTGTTHVLLNREQRLELGRLAARERFIHDSGGEAAGTWGSDEEFEQELAAAPKPGRAAQLAEAWKVLGPARCNMTGEQVTTLQLVFALAGQGG